MAREIKFRVWDNSKKLFHKPTYEAYRGRLEELCIGLSGDIAMRTMSAFIHCPSKFPDRFILSQYTGIKDKNGKEIYEGDIYSWMGSHYARHPRVVKWETYEDCETGFTGFDLDTRGLNRIEVIGNVYENPGLLKEGK